MGHGYRGDDGLKNIPHVDMAILANVHVLVCFVRSGRGWCRYRIGHHALFLRYKQGKDGQ